MFVRLMRDILGEDGMGRGVGLVYNCLRSRLGLIEVV